MRGSRAGAHEDAKLLGLSGNAMKLKHLPVRDSQQTLICGVSRARMMNFRMLNLPCKRGRGAGMQAATVNAHMMYGLWQARPSLKFC